ncbi:MAG: YeiH family protein [Eubacteriales bacterium]
MNWDIKLKKIVFLILIATSALPLVTTPIALTAGIVFGLFLGNPWREKTVVWSKKLLQISVIGLGFGLGIGQIWQTGKDAIVYTVVGITVTLIFGKLLGRFLKTNSNISSLISFGTAICGGSAIAAMAPVIQASDEETAVSLATVFTLNSIALFIFPYIGHIFHLNQREFGLWAALAIHDTSSVVGAAALYGSSALAIATTVKLARAVWIAPVALGTAWFKKSDSRVKIPLFIIGFIVAAGVRTLMPSLNLVWNDIALVAKQSLVVTLFLIGSGLTINVLQKVGVKPLLQALLLWFIVSIASFTLIVKGLIH